MKGRFPLTKVKLHRALLQTLQHPETKFSLKHMTKYGGDVDWDPILPPTNIKIVVDANAETDLIRFVIHELIHITMCGMFVGWVDDQLEEACMLGMEELVYAHVKKSPERERQWRAVLEAKFAEATKGDRLRTVEELTVRPKSDAR